MREIIKKTQRGLREKGDREEKFHSKMDLQFMTKTTKTTTRRENIKALCVCVCMSSSTDTKYCNLIIV